MANRIITRRDTAANWAAVNPVLAQGERAIEIDGLGTSKVKEKIGDGVTAWNSLPYQETGGGVEALSGDGVDNSDPKNPILSFPNAGEVGLGNVDNTSDANKPVSAATQSALNNKADSSELDSIGSELGNKASQSDLTNHTSATNNPHGVTKSQVGLSEVDNTSDANKPISNATQSALNNKADGSDLTNHVNDKNNPHDVDKADVGLGNVDNTSDSAKPISTATQSALNDKANDSDLTSHINNSSNPHGVTKAIIGLNAVDNTSDANKPVSTATQTALDNKADDSDLTSHVNNNSNPHGVDKADVGLGNADNTSDADKPISTDTQTALDTKLESVPNATHNVAGIVKMSRDSASSKVYISFDGTDVPNVS